MTTETDEPSVLGAGCGIAPMPTNEDRKTAWRAIYILTLVKAGVDEEGAVACFEAGLSDYDYSEDPEQAALEEMEYWTDDGDPA